MGRLEVILGLPGSVVKLAKAGGGGKKSANKKTRRTAGRRKGKSGVGCGTGAGGFTKGNSCNKGGKGGSGEDGPVTKKANKDAADEGMKAKFVVEKGPPRNAKEEKLLAKAKDAGKDAIVRTVTYKAWTEKEGSQKHFYHGDERVATVLPTKDIPSVKPKINGKDYDPSNFESVRRSKFTVITDLGLRGALVTGHPTQAKAEKVARSRVKDERKETDKEAEYKLVKDHTKANLVQGSGFGYSDKSRVIIRVLRPKGDKKPKGESMTTKTDLFKDTEAKCNRRRKIAALRDGIEGAGVTLYRTGVTGTGPWKDGELLFANGELPGYGDEAIQLINQKLCECGGKEVKKEDVYIHYMEAANSQFIGDRFMFLDATTLRNVASRGESGMAFMNSHRTGGLSAPSELPFGRTFSGRYEEVEHEGTIHRRALLGVYMLKGHYPNGKLGPSTDSLHRAIEAGTLSDVSIGLNGGQRLCDVCASDLSDKGCKHTPGTVKEMSPEQMESQAARGVAGGKASYTVVDGQPYEVSAVFKGAVPGAGFRKAMSLKHQAMSDRLFGKEVLSAYGSMMDDSDLKLFKGKPKMKFSDLLKLAGLAQSAGVELEDLDEGSMADLKSGTQVPVSMVPVKPSTQELDALEARNRELDARERDIDMMRFGVEADQFVTPLVSDGKITGPDIEALKLCYVQAAIDDKVNPITLSMGDRKVTRVEALKLANAGRNKHILTLPDQVTDTPVIPDGQKVLSAHDSPKDEDRPMSEERRKELHGYSVHGNAILNGK